jgi:hypothetical protein
MIIPQETIEPLWGMDELFPGIYRVYTLVYEKGK